jgi:quercetin dioxygenase-like cupin family protein
MLKGAVHVQYADKTEEVVKTGDAFYMPAGHIGWAEAGSAMILFSPEAEAMQVAEHVAKKMQG